MALIGAGFAIQSALRMRGEETAGHLEPLLATALARPRWAAGYVAVAMRRHRRRARRERARGRPRRRDQQRRRRAAPRCSPPASRRSPAVWVLAAVAVALFGLAPRAAGAALGRARRMLPAGRARAAARACRTGCIDLSPFEHVPLLPAADFSVGAARLAERRRGGVDRGRHAGVPPPRPGGVAMSSRPRRSPTAKHGLGGMPCCSRTRPRSSTAAPARSVVRWHARSPARGRGCSSPGARSRRSTRSPRRSAPRAARRRPRRSTRSTGRRSTAMPTPSPRRPAGSTSPST